MDSASERIKLGVDLGNCGRQPESIVMEVPFVQGSGNIRDSKWCSPWPRRGDNGFPIRRQLGHSVLSFHGS